ncbi:MAG: aminoglycoside phosphotransferase family protein [Pseudomonadota bacterium]
MTPVPERFEDITADWLSQALGVGVRQVDVLDAHAGTTGRALLQLHYDRASEDPASELPARLFAKFPPSDEMQRLFVTSSGMGLREARFYQSLAGEVPVRVPRPYYSDSDASGERYVMLLEDLGMSGCTLSPTGQPRDYILRVLRDFAALHAKYWDSQRFDSDLGWLQPPQQHDVAVGLVQQSLAERGSQMPAVFTAMAELYIDAADDIHALWNEGTPTVVHGDVHNNNLFLDGERPGFLDWALVARAPAMRDVGYFLGGALAPEDVADGEALLEYYREQLLALGVDAPSLTELRKQFAWHVAYVWVGAAVTLAMGDAWQPVEFVTRALERLHPTMEHLGSVDSLRSALGP